ncbi:MAG: hypothetical protein IPF55_13025 [Rhodoferax sp.]|nr:hypothetical protein [Rhodoferax sp.]
MAKLGYLISKLLLKADWKDAISAEKKVSDLSATLPALPHLNDWLLQTGILKWMRKSRQVVLLKFKVGVILRMLQLICRTYQLLSGLALELAVATLEKVTSEEKVAQRFAAGCQQKTVRTRSHRTCGTQWLSQNKQLLSMRSHVTIGIGAP